jgi:hypothetical protein
MIDALLQLGQEQRIPIGIEYVDAAAFRSRITLHEQDMTVGRLLDTITHPLGYSWFVDGDVVIVTHSGAPQGSKNLLDSRIPEFPIAREVTLQAASFQLLGKLYFALHPHATGIVGDYPSGNPQFRVGPWTMRNATVRQILNRIVSQHKNGAWVVQQPAWNMDRDPPTVCGGCSSTTATMERNTADCFRSGDWVYTILNSRQTFACPRLLHNAAPLVRTLCRVT